MTILLVILAAAMLASLATINILGGLPLDTDPPGTRWVRRDVRKYRNSLNGREYTHKYVYGSRFLRSMIRLELFPKLRLGFTPTPAGLIRDGLGHAELRVIVHEGRHGHQYEQMPPSPMPDPVQWPQHYFADQAALEKDANAFEAFVVSAHDLSQDGRPFRFAFGSDHIELDPNIFRDGVVRRAA